mmetsp:Transcript_9452/g.30196  ORF Transcript_9452/g.30196 Transcript_9452/m.30196 type:complete len:109 (+) Transcript_9452:249-575(+)
MRVCTNESNRIEWNGTERNGMDPHDKNLLPAEQSRRSRVRPSRISRVSLTTSSATALPRLLGAARNLALRDLFESSLEAREPPCDVQEARRRERYRPREDRGGRRKQL